MSAVARNISDQLESDLLAPMFLAPIFEKMTKINGEMIIRLRDSYKIVV